MMKIGKSRVSGLMLNVDRKKPFRQLNKCSTKELTLNDRISHICASGIFTKN